MDFSQDNLRSRLKARVPWRVPTGERTRYAATAAVLRYRQEPEILLIRRTEMPEDPWSGQMAFPGGRRDGGDADLVATAIRETQEEVGIDLSAAAELLGRLDDVQATARARRLDLVIVPHVFALHAPVTLRPSTSEVDEALWAPLPPMVAGQTATTQRWEHAGQQLELPGYQVGPHVVWGLTYRQLQLLFEVVRG
ncbi:MAG: CoA pyrophosphatase [Deltaproteobacteria bacterium]|nr:CoA pyrophosphatase [Deltaproteobacteria bacterium]